MKINTGHIFHITSYEIFKCKRYLYRGLFLSTKITHETTSNQLRVPDKHRVYSCVDRTFMLCSFFLFAAEQRARYQL